MSNNNSIERLRKLIAEQTKQLQQAAKDLNAAIVEGRQHDATRRLQAAAGDSIAAWQEKLRRVGEVQGRRDAGARFIEIREEDGGGTGGAGEGSE